MEKLFSRAEFESLQLWTQLHTLSCSLCWGAGRINSGLLECAGQVHPGTTPLSEFPSSHTMLPLLLTGSHGMRIRMEGSSKNESRPSLPLSSSLPLQLHQYSTRLPMGLMSIQERMQDMSPKCPALAEKQFVCFFPEKGQSVYKVT